jgi:hypothetical protein
MRDVRLRQDAQRAFSILMPYAASPNFSAHGYCIERMLCIAADIRKYRPKSGRFVMEYRLLTCYDFCVLDSDRRVVVLAACLFLLRTSNLSSLLQRIYEEDFCW